MQRAKRSAWAVVYTSHPRALDGDVLTLSFVSRGDVESFRQTAPSGGVSEVLRSAILEVLGLRVKFLPKVDGAQAGPEAPPETASPTEPQPAAGWGAPAAPPAERPAEVHRPPSPVVAPAAEQQRYGESVVREILGASFLEETVVAPREAGEPMYEGIVQELIDELGRLPGIGPKSAQRIAFHIVQTRGFDVTRLGELLLEVREKVRFCSLCGNVADQDRCGICRDPRRNRAAICVVEEPKDVAAIERTREYRGLYHVLGGALSPIDGIGPDDLRIRELVQRLADGEVREVILATDPNMTGEATATYLSRLLKTMDVPVSRLASGLPVGGDLEYADEVTLGRAFEGRRLVEH